MTTRLGRAPHDSPPSQDEPGALDRAAPIVFAALVSGASLFVLMYAGRYRWFFSDDWAFIVRGDLASPRDWFAPHNAHWSTVTFVTYRLWWRIFGITSYIPYQVLSVALHAVVVVLLRLVMRRAGVGPWLATVAAASMLLFSPGSDDIVWAFQIGYTGALASGLAQLLLADHDGGLDRRDAVGVALGILALMFSGVGITMAVVVFVAATIRRGFRIALVHTVPLAAAYLVYTLVEHPQTQSPFGRPTVGTTVRWVWSGERGVLDAIGHYRVVTLALAALLAAWVVLLAADRRRGLRVSLRAAATPLALVVGGVAFTASTAVGRWQFGPDAANSNRYLYVGAALVLPALACAIEAVGNRWRFAVVVFAPLLVVGAIGNLRSFEQFPYRRPYFAEQRRVLLLAPEMPFARQVARDVRPLPNPFLPPELNIGFLLDARKAGRLPSSPTVTAADIDEFRVRLGVSQRRTSVDPTTCRGVDAPTRITPRKGTVIGITSPVTISALDASGRPSRPVTFQPTNGTSFRIELAQLTLRLTPPPGTGTITLCRSS